MARVAWESGRHSRDVWEREGPHSLVAQNLLEARRFRALSWDNEIKNNCTPLDLSLDVYGEDSGSATEDPCSDRTVAGSQ